ncbi:hypothetical protein [Streptomyces sp. NBC_00078]|uniref:hypothetical protein n=1 Tax=unclassified Streptomyces TaxID=2593676 RepID=UPI002253100E|nr:hypothetical protein [Streptomyces sp. NBC_00078]MCX5424502.1 hypothetical protein [Streptomyces sp. NBC_00078]
MACDEVHHGSGAENQMQPGELNRLRQDCDQGEALLSTGDLTGAEHAFRAVLERVGPLEDASPEPGATADAAAAGQALPGAGPAGPGTPEDGNPEPGSEGDAASAERTWPDAVPADDGTPVDGSPERETDGSPDRLAARAHVGLGRLLLDAGETGWAEKEFRRAARLRPVDRDPLYWLGCSAAHRGAHQQGAYELAELRFTEVVERWDGDGPALVQRAYVRVRLGRPADALADLRSAERVGALDAEARWVLAALSGATAHDVARLLGAAARSAMERARATGPQGRSRAAADWSRAVALLDRARQLDPGEREFAVPHAVALCLSGRREDGLAILATASRSAPTDRHLAHTLAVMAWQAPAPDADGHGGADRGGTGGVGDTVAPAGGPSENGAAGTGTGDGEHTSSTGVTGPRRRADEVRTAGAPRAAGTSSAGSTGSAGSPREAGSRTLRIPGASGVGGGNGGSGVDVAHAWARCVAAWAGLLHDAVFWEHRRGEAAQRYGVSVDDKTLAALRADLQARLEARMPAPEAGDRTSPEALLNREIEAARLLAESGGLPLATRSAPLVCGPLRIVELGREPELGAFVAAAGEAAPALRQSFSHIGFAQALLRLDRPGEALDALSGLRCPSCRVRGRSGADGRQHGAEQPNRVPAATGGPTTHPAQITGTHAGEQPDSTPAAVPGHTPAPSGSARSRPARAPVCEPDCVHFDRRNPAYVGQAGRHALLLRDGRALALAARLAQARAALTPARPDVRRAEAGWQKALVHAEAIGQGAEVEGIVADTALGAAKALHRAGDIVAAGATLEAAYTLLRDSQPDRLKGQLARVLTDRGITQANRDMSRLEGPARDLRRAVELNPHLHRAQANLGVVLRILGARMRWSGSLVGCRNRLQEALDQVTAALAHFPGDPELTRLRDLVESDLALVHSELEQGRIGGLPQ